jgi:hypothetical protein
MATLNTYQYTFYWAAASVAASRFPVSSIQSLIVAGVELDVIGWRLTQLFSHVRFLLLLDGRKYVISCSPRTPTDSPATAGDQELDTRKTNGDSAKQILISQRVRSTNGRPDK